jgi:dTDP-4-dehydrorhamnose reductase
MKILITGGNGQVAYDVKRLAYHHIIHAPTHQELSISNFSAVHDAIENFKPQIVINAAAYTQVDRAEQDSENAFAANRVGAKNLAIVCEKFHIPLLHLSTDYVFNGENKNPYIEKDSVAPINIYGESKLRGEEEIQKHCENYVILRVSGVFGVHGVNFVKTMLRLAREREELRVVSDQQTCPTSAADIAATLLALCENPRSGIFHYCGSTAVSWYEFAKSIIKNANQYEKLKVKNIIAIPTSDYPTPAKRPVYSVLNCEKINKNFGIQQPDLEKGLDHVISTLYAT